MWIFRLLFTLLVLIAVFWFATTVKLGKHTLYGHLRAIFATQEAKDLAEGAKDEAKKIRERMREEHAAIDAGARDAAPLEHTHKDERKELDKLVKDKTGSKKK
jgi:hypothetical protein